MELAQKASKQHVLTKRASTCEESTQNKVHWEIEREVSISKARASSPSKGFEKEWRRREIGGGEGEGTAAVS
jgi:hypothetical protein